MTPVRNEWDVSIEDPLVPNEQSQLVEMADPLTESPKEVTQGPTAINAALLARLDESLGADFNIAFQERYTQLASLPIGEQEMLINSESLRINRDSTEKKLRELPFIFDDVPVAVPTTERGAGPTKEQRRAEFEQQVANIATAARAINAAANPAEAQLVGINIDKSPELTQQQRIEYSNQRTAEVGNKILSSLGVNPETMDYGWGQWSWELAKSIVLPYRANWGGWDMNALLKKFRAASPQGRIDMLPEMEKAITEYADGDSDIAILAVSAMLEGQTIGGDLAFEAALSPLYLFGWGIGDKLKRGGSAITALASRGANQQAGSLAANSIINPTVAAAAGTTPTAARIAADPFLKGLAPETVAAIEAARLKIKTRFNSAIEDVANRSPLTVDEQEAFIRSKQAKVPRAVSVTERDERGFKLVLNDGTTTQRITFTRDGIGQLDGVNEVSALGKATLSPSAIFRGTARENVQTASLVELEQSALGSSLGKVIDEVLETRIRDRLFTGIGRQEWEQLDGVLIQGDRLSRTFTAAELKAGVNVDGVGVVALSERQIAKYFEVRQVYDELYRVRDSVYRADLEFRGYRGIYTKVDGKPMSLAGREAFVTRDVNGVATITIPNDVKRVAYHGKTGLTGKNVDQNWVNSKTHSFVQFDKPVKIGNEVFEYGFISHKKLTDIKPGMLGFRSGYVPLYYNRVNYVVRQNVDSMVNGLKTRVTEVRRFFNTREEAERFANGANASITNKNYHYTVSTDREIRAAAGTQADQYRKQVEEAAFSGRYFQARNEDPIRYGIADIETPRMSAMDSLNRYTRAMAWAYPQTAFRQRMIAQFQNTYKKYLVDPTDWRSGFRTNSGLTTAQQNGINKYRETLQDWLSVRTEEETMFNNMARSIAETLEQGLKVGGRTVVSSQRLEGTRESLMRFGDADLIGNIKGATHHAMLGMFSLAQFFVQGLGLTIAASVDPVNFAKALPRFHLLRATAYMHPSDPKYAEMVKKLGKISLIDESEAMEMVTMFRKTGLARSLRNTSADYNAAENGLLVTKGMIGRSLDSGLVFYREGELLNRTISWTIGYLRAKGAQKAGASTDKLFEETMKQYYKVSFNLQKANAAAFQKGWASIPTQYWQITAKYLEHMVPGLLGREGAQWSRKEALTSLAVGAILYGQQGGIPFGKYFVNNTRNYVMGDTENGGLGIKDEDAATAIQGGMIDLFLGNLLGMGDVTVSLSSRAGIASGVVETIDRFRENPTVLEALSGATGSLASRSWESANLAFRILTTKGAPEENFNSERLALAASELGRIVGSWRNVHTARLWYNNQAVVNSKDRVVYNLEIDEDAYWALSNGEIFAKSIGFDSTRRGWERELANEAYGNREDMDNAISSMRQAFTRLSVNGEIDPKYLSIYESIHVSIRNSFSTEQEKAEFDKRWLAAFKEDPKLMRTLEAIVEQNEKGIAPSSEIETNPLLMSNME